MKNKVITSLILFIGLSIHAQIYTFDYKINFNSYNEKTKVSTNESSYLINSKNPLYEMHIFEKNGRLCDYENKTLRYISYNKVNNIYQFYSYQRKLMLGNDKLIDHIVVNEIAKNHYSIKCFPKKANKNAKLEIIVKLKAADEDLIRFYYLDVSYDMKNELIGRLKEKLNGNYNYIIESFSVNYRKNDTKSNSYITSAEKVNLKIMPQ